MIYSVSHPLYWKRRLDKAPYNELHQALHNCQLVTWKTIEMRHRDLLAKLISPRDSIFDAGCGWGRLIQLLPKEWNSWYYGVDLSPEFITLARSDYGDDPRFQFEVGDLRFFNLSNSVTNVFDWVIAIGVRDIIFKNLGKEAWSNIERQLRLVAPRILYLEYNETSEAVIIG